MTNREQLFNEMQTIAENKLQCTCGNKDWKQFLFVSADPEHVIAGCKRCGRTYNHEHNTWIAKGGPAPGVKP